MARFDIWPDGPMARFIWPGPLARPMTVTRRTSQTVTPPECAAPGRGLGFRRPGSQRRTLRLLWSAPTPRPPAGQRPLVPLSSPEPPLQLPVGFCRRCLCQWCRLSRPGARPRRLVEGLQGWQYLPVPCPEA